MDVFKTLLLDSPTVLASDGTGLLQASNNLSDVDDVSTARDNLGIESAAETVGYIAANVPQGFAVSDGSTTDRAERAQYGDVGDTAGLPASQCIEIPPISSNPSANAYLAARCASATATPISQANSQSVYIDTNGALVIDCRGTTPASDYRTLTLANYVSTYGATNRRLAIASPTGDTTTSPTAHLAGTELTLTSASSGTAKWQSADLDGTWSIPAYLWPEGRIPYAREIIGVLSDTEAAAYTSGTALEQAAPWTKYAGSAISLRAGETLVAGAHAPDTLTASGMAITSCIDDGTAVAQVINNSAFGPLTVGKTYAIYVPDFTLNSGSYPQLKIGTANNLTTAGSGYPNSLSYAGEQWTVFMPTGDVSNLRLGWRIDGATNFSHGEMLLLEIGPLDRPIYQPALATDDAFGRFSRLLVGMTPVSARSSFRVIGNTDTSGNEQVLGGAVLGDSDAVIDSVEFDTDGTPTITLGSASGGAQYVASTTLAAGLNADETLVTRKAASTALWVGSNGTSNVRTYVSGHKINGV